MNLLDVTSRAMNIHLDRAVVVRKGALNSDEYPEKLNVVHTARI